MTMPPEARTFVYVLSSDSRTITLFEMDRQSGDLSLIESVPMIGADTPPYEPAGANPGPASPMAISPDRRFLYAAARWEPYTVASFAIHTETGRLEHRGNAPLTDSMAFISTDGTGRCLIGASYPGHKLNLCRIDAGLAQAPHQIVGTTPNPHSARTDPSNHYLLAPSLGADVVLQYRFDAAAMTIEPSTPPSISIVPKSGPRHFVFHPNGRFVYLLNELVSTVYAFAFDATTGTLSALQSLNALPPDFSGAPSAADLHITPDGRFLYASERASSSLNAFAVDSETGALTPAGSFPTEKQPRGFNIDPSGRYLIAAGQLSGRITVHAIDSMSGALTPLRDYAAGRNPNWVEIIDLP